jgi:photosystem II stability/assembly factor-like uncharacterized protein
MAGLFGVLVALACTQAALAAPVSVGRSGWLWGDPGPQGETLNQVAFQGVRGYAVGAGGTVLRSDDGGQTWVGLASGTEADLTLLDEVDASTIVAGGSCTVRESSDAGLSFHRLSVEPSESGCAQPVAGLSFLSATTGYVELSDGTVLFTTDGGQSVQQKTSVPLSGATAEQIYFRSTSVGYAVVSGPEGGRIYRTTDGAGSWTQVGASPNKEPLYSLTFVTPTTAYAVGGGLASPGMPADNGTLVLVSEDEGQTWAERHASAEHVRSIELPPGTPPLALHQIACSDALHCLIATGTKTLVYTGDGALTGSLVSPSEQNILSVAFTSGLNAIGVGAGGTVVQSGDGGVTFGAPISHGLASEFSGPVRLGATPQDAYVATRTGAIAATTDGGAEWGLLRVPTADGLAGVAFSSAADGYAVNDAGTVFRTSDGGQAWAIESSGGEAPSTLLAPSASTALLVGPTGLRRSTDAGATFAHVGGSVVVGRRHGRPVRRSLSAFPLFAGAQMAGSAIVAWGDEAIESTDGGADWTLIPRPLAKGNVEDVSFVSASTGYEISRQRLFFTRNRGRTWTEISSLGSQPLALTGGVSFSSVADGYVGATFAGRRNVVMRTSNGGRSWAPELLPRNVEAVTAGGSVDYLSGGNALFETTDGGLSPSASTLTLALSGPHSLSHAKLAAAHGHVQLKGLLSPALAGESVVVSYRTAGTALWQHRTVTVAAGGRFSLTVAGIRASTVFVAQWSGAGGVAGAGSVAVNLTVKTAAKK